jgi:hypothetical protein
MSSNIELIMNPYISSVYITTTNMLLPILTITLVDIYNYLMIVRDHAMIIRDYLIEQIINIFIRFDINLIDISIISVILFVLWLFINIMDDNNAMAQKIIRIESQFNVLLISQREINETREQETINLFNQLITPSQTKLKTHDEKLKTHDEKLKTHDKKLKKITNDISLI